MVKRWERISGRTAICIRKPGIPSENCEKILLRIFRFCSIVRTVQRNMKEEQRCFTESRASFLYSGTKLFFSPLYIKNRAWKGIRRLRCMSFLPSGSSCSLQRFRPFLYVLPEIDNFVVIGGIHQAGMQHEICCGFVDGHGYIVDLGDPHQGLDIRIMGLGRQRV